MIQKVIYKSQSCDIWGEYEIDHIFFLKENFQSIPFNTNEIGELKWLTREEFKPFLEQR
jgi:isopentenyldiphosphate isomerase